MGEGHLLKNQLKNMEDLPRLPDDYLADRPWDPPIPGLRMGRMLTRFFRIFQGFSHQDLINLNNFSFQD